jgi:hypothetical protein
MTVERKVIASKVNSNCDSFEIKILFHVNANSSHEAREQGEENRAMTAHIAVRNK